MNTHQTQIREIDKSPNGRAHIHDHGTRRIRSRQSAERSFSGPGLRLAYLDEPEGPAQFRDRLGLNARLISVGNTQVYVAQGDRTIVVAFRGSQAPTSLDGLKDWLLTNANNYLIIPEGRIGTDFAAAGVRTGFIGGSWKPLPKSGSRF